MSEHTYFSEGSYEELVGHLLGKVRVSCHLKFLGNVPPFAFEELLSTTWGLQEGEEEGHRLQELPQWKEFLINNHHRFD